jgi:hypothetical protein
MTDATVERKGPAFDRTASGELRLGRREGRRDDRRMIRRTFLAGGLMILGFSRRAWAQLASAPARYVSLAAPVRIPLDAVRSPWSPVPFRAEAVAPPGGTTPARRVLINGVLFRRVTGDERPQMSALCVTCTHEQCQVDFIAEPTPLPRTGLVM